MSKIRQVLVTGGAGYVGSVLVPRLLASGYRVRVLDLYLFGEQGLKHVEQHPALEQVKGDIRDRALVSRVVSGCDAVIHLACVANDPSFELNPVFGRQVNYEAFRPLVAMSWENAVRRFVYVSSSSVYGVSDAERIGEDHPLVPITDYNRYKALCEKILHEYQSSKFTTVAIRCATVCGYSPRQRLDLTVNILTNQAVNLRRITVFGGRQMRPNIHILDIVDLYEMLLRAPDELITGKIYNAGHENYRVAEIGEIVREVVTQELPQPREIELTTTPSDDIRSYRICSQRIKEDLGFVPRRTVTDAVKDLVKAFTAGRLPNPMSDARYYNIKTMAGLNPA